MQQSSQSVSKCLVPMSMSKQSLSDTFAGPRPGSPARVEAEYGNVQQRSQQSQSVSKCLVPTSNLLCSDTRAGPTGREIYAAYEKVLALTRGDEHTRIRHQVAELMRSYGFAPRPEFS